MNIYQQNIEKYKNKGQQLAEMASKLALVRVIFFVTSFLIILMLANEKLLFWILLVTSVCLFGFGILINKYNKIVYQRNHTNYLREVNEKEVLRLDNRLEGLDTGERFINSTHAYVPDFDIFGEHSLFQLINRTTTETGKALLANWLSAPAFNETIVERQKAVQELYPKLDWRQDFQALGMHYGEKESDFSKMLYWMNEPVKLLPQKWKYLCICIGMSILSLSALALFLSQVFSPNALLYLIPLVVVLFINSRILKGVSPVSDDIIENGLDNIKILGAYKEMIVKIESESFSSSRLHSLQSVFQKDGYSASTQITRLKKILEVFKQRGVKNQPIARNLFYPLINNYFLLDIYWILLVESWKRRNYLYLPSWSAAVSEFEVFNSLAGFHYSNPDFTFPQLTKEPYIIQFERLGHPLISPEKRVSNDFNLSGRGQIAIITGSNMAGKSTFLRTVGINLVLALTGAPICARSARISNMKIFSSMRTQDNLSEGVSSFYAELKRIKQLLELIEKGEPILFMLDEMFKGTNSQDRHLGGLSLINQLSQLNAFGLISTHDLELASSTNALTNIRNYSFNSDIREDEINFNYKLTEGICKDFNASKLMKKIGIKILPQV